MSVPVSFRIQMPEWWDLCFTHAVEAAAFGLKIDANVADDGVLYCRACQTPDSWRFFLDQVRQPS